MEHGRLELKPGNGQACAPAPQTWSTGSPWILQRQPAPSTPQDTAPRPGRSPYLSSSRSRYTRSISAARVARVMFWSHRCINAVT